MDVKAEHFERQVQRVEQERDTWEKKYEVHHSSKHDPSRSCKLIIMQCLPSTGSSSEISRVKGGVGRARSEHGRLVIESHYSFFSILWLLRFTIFDTSLLREFGLHIFCSIILHQIISNLLLIVS